MDLQDEIHDVDVHDVAVRDVMASPGVEALARRLLDLLGRITGLESTYLTAIHWDEDVQEILYSRNVGEIEIPEGLRVPWSDTLCRRALEGGPHCVSDVPSVYPDSGAARELGITTYATFPIVVDGDTVVGTLCGISASGTDLSADALAVMETLADMVSVHVESERIGRELRAANSVLEGLALTDVLTGVGNRRALEEHLARACAEAVRHGVPVGVVTFDVDHFKSINDTFGHGAGDDVLRAVAAQLSSHTRPADLVTRPGGDEFSVVLLGADVTTASAVAERVRRDLSGVPIETRDGPVPVTVSVGVTSCRYAGPEQLLGQADEALYRAKAAGRDAVVAGTTT